MQRAVEAFESDFARWDLHLPAEAIESRRAGQIRDAGWSIRYNFGRDTRGEYLDYYASPRDVHDDAPGDDWHVRVYASGERATLPPVLEAYMYGRDPTWEELERARRQFDATSSGTQTDGSGPADPSSDSGEAETGEIAGSTSDAFGAIPAAADAGDVGLEPTAGDLAQGEFESDESPAAPDGPAPYLSLDIGLHMDLDLPGEPARADAEAESPVGAPSQSVTDAPPDLFYSPEDLSQFLPTPPEETGAERSAEMPAEAPARLPFRSSHDDMPAPITLDVPVVDAARRPDDPDSPAPETAQRPDDLISEEDAPAPETLSEVEAQGVESIGAVPLAEPDSLSHVPLVDEGAAETADVTASGEPSEASAAGAQAPPLAGKAIPTKIFRRADLVLTAEAASVKPYVDPKTFRPWWFRANARRAAIAVAAAGVIAIVMVARARHRAKAEAEALGSDADTSAMNLPPVPAAASSAPADSSGPGNAAASPDSQPAPSADSATSVSAPAPPSSPDPIPDLRSSRPGAGDPDADAGMAKPAGPRSLEPIIPSGKAAAPASKYPSGTFPRGYSP